MKLPGLGLLLLVAAMGVPLARGDGDRAADAGVRSNSGQSELLTTMLIPWQKVRRFEVEYSAIPSKSSLLRSAGMHQLLSVGAPGDLHELTAHAPGYVWDADPYSQELFIHHGEMVHRWPFNRAFSQTTLPAGGPLPGTAPDNIMWAIFPVWLLTDYKAPSHAGIPIIVSEALKMSDYQLLPGSEVINGELCSVWDRDGVDRVWLASKKGLCVMRRDWREPKTGDLIQRILTDNVTAVAPGLWLPTQFRRQIFAFGTGTNRGALVMESAITIERCVLNNEVLDSAFVPTSPAGSIKYDENDQFTQSSPGGEDLLDRTTGFLVRYGHLPTTPIPQNHVRLWWLVGAVTGAFAAFLLLRRTGKAPVEQPGLELQTNRVTPSN